MANASAGYRLTSKMADCLTEAKRHNLSRIKGNWIPVCFKVMPGGCTAFDDRTVHALIVRGLLIVIDRQVNSRMPTLVRLAKDYERI